MVEARKLYKNLSIEQQKEVTNYALLESSEEGIVMLEVAKINKFIMGLNLNYLQADDESKATEIKAIYDKLPAEAKSEINNPEKIKQAFDIYKNYSLGKDKASRGEYEAAYDLMVDLNYLDSKTLAKQYEKIAFPWWIEGRRESDFVNKWADLHLPFMIHGGKEGEEIDIIVKYQAPDWSCSQVYRGVTDGYLTSIDCSNPFPMSALSGTGTVTFKIYSTGELIETFQFWVE